MTNWIQNKRKELGLSQLEVAKTLGISRPTYDKLEKGQSKPSSAQEEILKKLFSLSDSTFKLLKTDPIIGNSKNDDNLKRSTSQSTSFKKVASKKEASKQELFDDTDPVEDTAKFKEVLLYLVNKTADKPNIGQTALYKLLYFIDFDFYEKYFKAVIGAVYIKNNYGPTPVSFAKIVKELEREGKLVEVKSKYFNFDQTRYMVTKEPEIKLLDGMELKHIDDEISRLANKSARELSELSHIDTPWRVAKDREVLIYDHAFYRPEETSIVEESYED